MPFSKSSKKGQAGREGSPEPGPSKREKYSSDEDEEPLPRKGKSYQSSKMSKQGKISKKSPNVINKQSGHSSHNKPAELFRKDLISAMKMADTEILYDNEYVIISDPWRQEWEKGVQVPVNEEEIPPSVIREIRNKPKNGDFKLPLRKYLHEKIDDIYQVGQHEMTGMQDLADQIVRYDLDDQDVSWLQLVNDDREEMGLQLINEWNLERIIEELENQCYIKTNAWKKTEEGLGIEYDEDVACDVCRMLESEDTNEMVFCDGCDICVHQACYGIQTIPEGSWLCRICALGIKPMCLLCPKRGGAMKSTKSGTKWTHVSCALWIPEVSIGCPEKMEPITKISNIPPSRWALVCCLCKERVGACIQCSVKQCKTAFHVTCGFAHNLDMKTIVDDSDDADGIHLRAYCPKHTKNRNASESESPKKEESADNENDISEAEMAKKRMEKLKQIEEEFYTLVDIKEVANKFYIPEEAADIVAEYWKLKRKVNNNKPLITPKMEEEDQMQKQQKDSLSARMKMFVHLRQDLERARNLCYMISKREKTKRQLFKLKENVFRAQIRVLTDPDLNLSAREAEKIRLEYQFDSIYSNYGVMSPRSSKQPRVNLFTLENLKTPKDFVESDEDHSLPKEGQIHLKTSKLGKEVNRKDRDLIQSGESYVSTDSVSGSAVPHRENLFSVDDFKIIDDSTAESSEDEILASVAKTTHSSQMSRLGKVNLKEIEEKTADGEPGDVIAVPELSARKFYSSDLKRKLTSILQSKTMIQQCQEKVHSGTLEPISETLHVDVENSDSDIFTSDTNTDLTSPADQPRNLFDKFRLQGKSVMSSPDLPGGDSFKSNDRFRGQHKKSKKRKHSQSLHRHKKSRSSLLSPSDQSSISSVSARPETATSVDLDRLSIGQTSQILSDDTDQSVLSLVSTAETSVLDYISHKHTSSPQSKYGKGKKKRSRRDYDSSESSNKSQQHTLKILPPISPSPRVNPDNIFGTIDGDIYVPTGKIKVTERTIVLDDLKEEDRSPVRSKLKLKKQANSPVKGIVSYEVVKDENDRLDIFEDDKVEVLDSKNIFDRVMETSASTSRLEISEKTDSEMSSYSQRSSHMTKLAEVTSEKSVEDSGPTTRQKAHFESDISENIKEVKVEKVEVESKKELPDLGNRRGRRRGNPPAATSSQHDDKNGNTSDENFKPKDGSPKVSAPSRSSRPRRSRTTRQFHPDETDGDDESDDFVSSSPSRRKCTHNHASSVASRVHSVKLKPLPTKPELTALLDSSKLIVKEELRKQVGDRLGAMLKRRGRWSNGLRDSSQTLDKFMKKSSSSENIFSKPDVVRDPNAKLLTLPLARSDLSPLCVNKSSTVNSLDSNNSSTKANSLPVSPIKAAVLPKNIFGAHSSPRGSLSSYRIPRKSDASLDDQNKTLAKVDGSGESKAQQDPLFGDGNKLSSTGLRRQLSFEDVSKKSDLVEVVKTPSKCNSSELAEDRLDGHRSYRSPSPPSSEGSGASSRILHLDSRESTPSRRVTRSHFHEDSSSPLTRTRRREGFLKAPQFKLS